MRIDLSNIDAENQERIYIKKEGEYVLKVVKVTQGKTSNNNEQIKVHFQDRKGQYAMDLVHPYRLVFEKTGDKIQIANVMEIVDYH